MEWSRPIPLRRTLTDSLAQSILELMRDENLERGDRLPSVKELAERFQVAVPTLREAIRRLEAFGVLEVKHGSGIFVRSAHPPMMLVNPSATAISSRTILDLLDTRLLFEPHCAEQAALHAGSPEVAVLAGVLDRAEKALSGDDAVLQDANMAFHVGVAACAGNVVLAQVMSSLSEIYASEQTVMLTISNKRQNDHEQHCSIYEAIKAGDSQTAADRMRDHILAVKEIVSERLAAAGHAHKVAWLGDSSTSDSFERTPLRVSERR